jgi:LuxR family transcriptional regulator, maltose regulon positive regulatory protein
MSETTEQATSVANRHIIERPRLMRRLDEAGAKVITLVAPAGYGKTTLARQWLAHRPHAWYTASAASGDVGALGLGLVEAAAAVAPGVGQRFRDWLHARRGTEEVSLAADLLVDDLVTLPADTCLAIDDYQWLTPDGEKIIELLSHLDHIKLLLTSRRRPQWISSRALLYGEVFELESEALAMSHDEATQVLRGLDQAVAQDLIGLANGWPAVIALASFTGTPPPLSTPALPPTLHAYIADELFASIEPSAHIELAQLALLPNPTSRLAQHLVGPASDEVIAEALRVGFLTEEDGGSFSIHPLLRTFLRRKLSGLPPNELEPVLGRAVKVLVQERLWDGAFDVVLEFERPDLLDAVLEASIYDLLDRGLLATLSKFIDFGRALRSNASFLDLAEAELAFRSGFHERARLLAEEASIGFENNAGFASKSLCLAGHCAYFADELGAAEEHFRRARTLAQCRADERRAVWGLFLCAIENEDEAADTLLEQFEQMRGTAVDDLVRAQNGRLHVGMRLGSLNHGLSGAEAVAAIVSEACDPVVRTSFWHVYAGALRAAGAYASVQRAVDRALDEIETFDLDFARAHVQLTRASACAGMKAYEDALALLDDVAEVGKRNGDTYLQMSERTMRCRVCLLRGDVDGAARATDTVWQHVASSGQHAEFLACRALALGMAPSQREDPLGVLAEAEQRSSENEATLLCRCVRASLSLDHDADSAATIISHAFRLALGKGVIDPIIFALRVDNRLAPLIGQAEELRPALNDILSIVDASGIATHASVRGQPFDEAESLTKREREVLQLIAEGLTNIEIATRLFLTLATVKVHVRNILRKLGVRSRTEAAIYALKMQRHEADVREP